MLFLLRPRQTYMPYALPRDPRQQQVQNQQVREAYSATQRVGRDAPDAAASTGLPVAQLKQLADLHQSGALTDDEFSAAKAKVLGSDGGGQ